MTHNFVRFNPSLHTLKVGDVIKLGGREGKITEVDHVVSHKSFVKWDNSFEDGNFIDLRRFPDLEIAIPSPRISKAAASELKRWTGLQVDGSTGKLYGVEPRHFYEKIDSMVGDE